MFVRIVLAILLLLAVIIIVIMLPLHCVSKKCCIFIGSNSANYHTPTDLRLLTFRMVRLRLSATYYMYLCFSYCTFVSAKRNFRT